MCSSQTRSFAATQQKIVFIIFKILMFTLVHFVSCSIAISIIILLKVNASHNENLFIYAYGYCIYPACEVTRSCYTSHKAIVESSTSLLCSLYPSGCPDVVYTSSYLFLHVVLVSSFCSIAVLLTTLIFRTFARYSLFLFCLFYNTLHILTSSSSQRAMLHSPQ